MTDPRNWHKLQTALEQEQAQGFPNYDLTQPEVQSAIRTVFSIVGTLGPSHAQIAEAMTPEAHLAFEQALTVLQIRP